MKINSFNNYSMNKPPSADRIQKIVQQLNTRAQSSISSASAAGRAAAKAGLDEIEDEKDREDPFLKLFEKGRVGAGSNPGQLMKDIYVTLEGMKQYADIIGKYEALAADETKSEEERAFYQNAIPRLKEGFKTELYRNLSWNKTRNMTMINSNELVKEFGLDDISDMTSQELISALEKAQQSLGKPQDNDDTMGFMGIAGIVFEPKYTEGLKGYDKYGYKTPQIDPNNVTGEIISFEKDLPPVLIDTKA